MSLINDALKKAQRQRTNNPFGIEAPLPGGGGQVARRGSRMPAQTIVMIVAGCAILVVLSAVTAVYFVNRAGTPTQAPAVSTLPPPPATPAAPAGEFPTLAITPIILAGGGDSTVVTNNPPITAAPPPPISETNAESPAPAPLEKTVAPEPIVTAAPVATAPPPVTEERVNAFLDALRITGVRAAGANSRVLLNEKVYRVNDTVDRALGLKLIAVETGALRFSDVNGVKYVKNF